jgi:antitoxin MazE
MEAVLRRWGNSMAVRFPSTLVKACRLKEDAKLVITEEEGKIVLTPKKKQPRYNLKSLLAQITVSNKHEAVDFGEPVGQELL